MKSWHRWAALVLGAVTGGVAALYASAVFIILECGVSDTATTVPADASLQSRYCTELDSLLTTWPVWGFAATLLLGLVVAARVARRARSVRGLVVAALVPAVLLVPAYLAQAALPDGCTDAQRRESPPATCART